MSNQLEQEFKALINIALKECRIAISNGDYETAEYFREEALDLILKLSNKADQKALIGQFQ